VLAAVGLLIGLGLSQRTAIMADLQPDKIWDAGLFAVIAAFVLSRLLLVATHGKTFLAYPLLLLAVPSLTASGLLLTAIATLGWLRWKGIPLANALDAWAPCAAVVWGFLALGHFAEGSDPGMVTSVPWGMKMPGDAMTLHPVALYVSVLAWGLAVLAYRRVRHKDAAALTLVGAGAGQFLISFVRQPGLQVVAGLDVLEWVAVAMMVAGVMIWVSAPMPGAEASRGRLHAEAARLR
jgi:phosphatidylglycerol:prolipoprotein diacylglycerol transferase